MGIMISPETLRRYSLFANLDHEQIKALAMAGQKVAVRKGDWLFCAGCRADALYVILSGELDLTVDLDAEGSRYTRLCTLVEGDLLGWSAVVEPFTYRLGALATQDACVARWDSVSLCELMTHHPAIGYLLMSRIARVIGDRLDEFCLRFASLVEGDQWQSVVNPHTLTSSQN